MTYKINEAELILLGAENRIKDTTQQIYNHIQNLHDKHTYIDLATIKSILNKIDALSAERHALKILVNPKAFDYDECPF